MNPDLAAVLLINLVKNAIVHNIPGGYVAITIDKGSLTIENSGMDKPLDKEKIFSRFHADQSTQSSTGLGLAIVKAIGDLYGFEVAYHFDLKHIIRVGF